MQTQLHEHTKEEWTAFHRDQELELFLAQARNGHREPAPYLYDV